jgi:hypothetical protein
MDLKGQEESSAAVSSAGVEHSAQSGSPSTQITAVAANPHLVDAIKGLIEQVMMIRDKEIQDLKL